MDRPALSPSAGIWLTTVLWAATALGLWGYYDHQLRNGAEIALRAVPVDPRDVLRGDYVVLRYEISSARRGGDSGWWFADDETVFVSIDQTGGEWRVSDLSREPPDQGLFLRGRIRSAGGDRFEIAYGIESFFVPEGEGVRYEEARNRNRLWAIVSVSPQGVALLKRLEIR